MNKKIIFPIIIILLAFTGCFSPFTGDGNLVTFRISVPPLGEEFLENSNSSRFLPEPMLSQVRHTVTLYNGPGAVQSQSGIAANQSVSFTVVPGTWDIRVEGYINNETIAIGTAFNVNISHGANESVIIQMKEAFEVSFDNNGGTGTIPSIIAAGGDIITLPGGSGFTLSGFIFSHWEDGLGTIYNPGDQYTVLEDITLIAQWTAAPPFSGTFSFTAGGINSGLPSLLGLYIEGQTLTATFTTSDGTGTATYVWRSDGNIVGTNSPNYTITESDRGNDITVEISFSENSGSQTSTLLPVHLGRPISTVTQLMDISMGENYILVNDIGPVTQPIPGTYYGTFDGNGNTISLSITGTEIANVGLFTIIGGTVKNLRLTGLVEVNNFTMGLRAGALAGTNQGTISNVSSSVNVSSTTGNVALTLGGLVGSSNRTIRNSYTTGNVIGFTTANSVMIGGIVGSIDSNTNNISFCWAQGTISGTAGNVELVGGIVGNSGNAGTEYEVNLIQNCVALNSNLISGGYDNNNKIARRIAALWGATPTLRNNYANVLGGGPWTTLNNHDEANGANFPDPDNIGNWTAPSGPGWTIYNVPIINPAHTDAPTELNPWWWLDGPDRPRLWFESGGVNLP